ncbi:alpha/beta hydrolase [Glycocaulis alkaliphilus]|uniref:Alpha/beta hydrolase n=2 Tax=Glycocaulis alkaliphilus TaxID=1434191 RepID=A0A3T0E656_9PROT|nr:alpha/beta hydrolase [Glycocaulis alkaliphilus]GGB80121.1 alpha/beta hydrolase [Glycocaulis alkaliphilus]
MGAVRRKRQLTRKGSLMPEFLHRADGSRLAYARRKGKGPGIVWLGGLRSDMEGTKALALDAWAQREGRAFVRFDYFAHGQSEGDWRAARVGLWREDALQVIDALTEGPQILVGSSMGAWTALLAALARPERVAGLVLIAPAPDFTEKLMWDGFPEAVRTAILTQGEWAQPSEYGDPLIITRGLIEEARQWLLMDGQIGFEGPVRILQGMADIDVPWQHAMALAGKLTSGDVSVHVSKSGDHRLSTPADLEKLVGSVEALCRAVESIG